MIRFCWHWEGSSDGPVAGVLRPGRALRGTECLGRSAGAAEGRGRLRDLPPIVEQALRRSDGSKGGRPPIDPVMMFKILILQALYGLSDEQVEFQIRDRLSFMRFLGLGLADRVPDYSTIWRFREALVAAGAIEELFAHFDHVLTEQGYLALGGQLIDASIVEAPRQRLTVAEKQLIRSGEQPDWPAAKARHKDTDARWTVKRAGG
jgi:IS5 family transposase